MISAALAILETDEQRNELSEIYETNKNRFYAIAFEHLHNKDDAEDAIQESFLRIAKSPDKFFSIDNNKRINYICIIIRNVSVDFFKKNVKNKNESNELSDDLIYENDISPLENSLLSKVSHTELMSFIKNLPVLQRNVLFLTCLSELSIDETAKILKISKTAVNQRLYLARKSIKEYIEERSKNDE